MNLGWSYNNYNVWNSNQRHQTNHIIKYMYLIWWIKVWGQGHQRSAIDWFVQFCGIRTVAGTVLYQLRQSRFIKTSPSFTVQFANTHSAHSWPLFYKGSSVLQLFTWTLLLHSTKWSGKLADMWFSSEECQCATAGPVSCVPINRTTKHLRGKWELKQKVFH